MFVAVISTVTWAIVAMVLGIGFLRYRMSRKQDAPGLPPDTAARLARIEAGVESIALEVERISENQRFLTKLQTDRPPLVSGGVPERPR
jgi:hypothetical protein